MKTSCLACGLSSMFGDKSIFSIMCCAKHAADPEIKQAMTNTFEVILRITKQEHQDQDQSSRGYYPTEPMA